MGQSITEGSISGNSMVQNESNTEAQYPEIKRRRMKVTQKPLTNLNLAKADEWSVNNKNKIIFLKNKGYYYYVEKGGGRRP